LFNIPGLWLDNAVIFTVSFPRLKYHEIFLEFTYLWQIKWDTFFISNDITYYIYLGDNCIVFENFTASIGDLMVTNWVYWRRVDNWCHEIFKYNTVIPILMWRLTKRNAQHKNKKMTNTYPTKKQIKKIITRE
jgi:hypothetical protein